MKNVNELIKNHNEMYPELASSFADDMTYEQAELHINLMKHARELNSTKFNEDLRSYIESILFQDPEEVKVLERMWDAKLEQGIELLLYEDQCCYTGLDYVITDEDREILAYTNNILKGISNMFVWVGPEQDKIMLKTDYDAFHDTIGKYDYTVYQMVCTGSCHNCKYLCCDNNTTK